MHTVTEPADTTRALPDARSRTIDLLFRRAQALSGLALTAFASIHLANSMLAAIPGAYDPFQRVVRQAYQSPVLEVLFVCLPLVVHLVAGIRALVKRRARTADAPLRTRLHRYAAWYLLLVIAGHVLATRGASLFYGVHPEFIGLRFAVAWLPWFFIPYYALLGVSGVVHVAQGVPVALGILQKRVPSLITRPSTFWPVVALFSFAITLGVAGIAGWLYEVSGDPLASDYAQIYRDLGQSPFVPDVPDPR
jgi:hypothetical protein